MSFWLFGGHEILGQVVAGGQLTAGNWLLVTGCWQLADLCTV